MSERIMTLHPEGKQGVNIEKAKYDAMAEAIITSLQKEQPVTFNELSRTVSAHLNGKFDGSITWYYTTVKLDLEARGEIERVPKSSPQQIRLAASK